MESLAPVAEGPGRFIAIGHGRTLYMECIGSGSPTVVLEAGFGADTQSWQDVQTEVSCGSRYVWVTFQNGLVQ